MIPWEIQNVIFEQYSSYVRMNKMNCNRTRVIVKLPSHLKNVAALPCVIQNSYTRPKKYIVSLQTWVVQMELTVFCGNLNVRQAKSRKVFGVITVFIVLSPGEDMLQKYFNSTCERRVLLADVERVYVHTYIRSMFASKTQRSHVQLKYFFSIVVSVALSRHWSRAPSTTLCWNSAHVSTSAAATRPYSRFCIMPQTGSGSGLLAGRM